MEPGIGVVMEILDNVNTLLMELDECFAANDTNKAIMKTHECLLMVKTYKECFK